MSLDWEEIIGKIIEAVDVDIYWAQTDITFTDGTKVRIDGGSNSGYPVLEINEILEEE